MQTKSTIETEEHVSFYIKMVLTACDYQVLLDSLSYYTEVDNMPDQDKAQNLLDMLENC